MIVSPNTVFANALTDPLDLVRARLQLTPANRVVFSVGTQINGLPHIGTFLVQAASFVLAQKVRERLGVEVSVVFGALDNAPFEVTDTPAGTKYQIAYAHASQKIDQIIQRYYLSYFEELRRVTGVSYSWQTYSEQQKSPGFRGQFLESVKHLDRIRWALAPSNGVLRARIPCPHCHYAEKGAERIQMVSHSPEEARFEAVCFRHGRYEATVRADGQDDSYLDLNTLYRNLVKELDCSVNDPSTLHVMVKGGDWIFGSTLVDWAFAAMGYNALQIPMRVFTPQIVAETGAKLSKSLIRSGDASMSSVPEWLLDMGKFADLRVDYAECMVWLMNQFLSHPRHMFRAYSYQEIVRLIERYTGNITYQENYTDESDG